MSRLLDRRRAWLAANRERELTKADLRRTHSYPAETSITALEALGPNQGILLADVSLTAYSANDIEHGLGRALVGYSVVRNAESRADFSVYLAADQTGIVTSTWTRIKMASERHDNGGNYSTSAWEFAAPHNGLYQFAANILTSPLPDAGRALVQLRKNGAEWLYGTQDVVGGADPALVSVSAMSERLAAGDLISVWAFQDTGGDESVTGDAAGRFTRFSGRAISELEDGQGELPDDDPAKYLRLYSSRDRTVSLWVW